MKVLVTCDAVGGVWNHTVELTRGLSRAGVKVVVACLGSAPSDDQVGLLARCDADVHVLPFDLEWMADPWDDVARGRSASGRLIEEEAPDLLHLNGYCQDPGGHGLPVVIGAHSTLHGWWRHVRGTDVPPEAWSRYAAEVRAGVARADAVVAPTAAMLAEVDHHYGPLPGGATVIPNGRDPTRFSADADTARKAPGASVGSEDGGHTDRDPAVHARGSAMILWSGRTWDEGNDIRTLDEAVGRGLSWPVVATGPDAAPDGTRTATRHLERPGPLKEADYLQALASAAIYVSTSRYEPFGLGPLDAAFSGSALVLPDLSTLREVWGENACFVPPGDPEALHKALHSLIHDPVRRQDLARRARDHALGRYTSDRMAARYLELYERLIDEQRDGPKDAAKRDAGGRDGSRHTDGRTGRAVLRGVPVPSEGVWP